MIVNTQRKAPYFKILFYDTYNDTKCIFDSFPFHLFSVIKRKNSLLLLEPELNFSNNKQNK